MCPRTAETFCEATRLLKTTTPATLRKIRKHLEGTHATYVQRFEELLAAAREEKEQERERGGK